MLETNYASDSEWLLNFPRLFDLLSGKCGLWLLTIGQEHLRSNVGCGGGVDGESSKGKP